MDIVMLQHAAQLIKDADIFIITTGAGMGVDSGLPDFRGDSGFWQAYPPYAQRGISFVEAANPLHFSDDPAFGWGFYGHRINLYRETIPHEGFHIIQHWIEQNRADYFVVTSNVDGQFQKAGYDEERMLEVHGSIHWLQCLQTCSHEIWENNENFDVNMEDMRVKRYPRCLYCDEVARPNILMFGDSSWVSDRKNMQLLRFRNFRKLHHGKKVVVLELGAGISIPTIRSITEDLGSEAETFVIRINPREAEISAPHISLPCSALDGLRMIDGALERDLPF
jgi:NAD-dependent SIR2 family protein deacetylase